MVIAVAAVVALLCLHSLVQLQIEHLDKMNEQRIRAGTSDALAVSNSCRVEARLALEKIAELRETLASSGIQYKH